MARHVLVVDDEGTIRRIVQINLTRAGYRVSVAEDGIQAIELARQEKPDLIVLDVMMPRMDGFEALQRLKSDPETQKIPVIMLTARSQDADFFEGERRGADLYLTKPFSPGSLLDGIRTIEQQLDG